VASRTDSSSSTIEIMGTCVKTLFLGCWHGESSKLRERSDVCESWPQGAPRKLYLGLNGPVISDGADPLFSFAIQAQRAGNCSVFGAICTPRPPKKRRESALRGLATWLGLS
jgi:hypothetical protein